MQPRSTLARRGPLASSVLIGALALALTSSARSVVVPPPVRVVPPPIIHLTWHEPYGSPRATTSITSSCDDTLALDTLWLTYECPERGLHLMATSGSLLFEPQAGDSLGPFWGFERGGPNSGNLFVEFAMPVQSPIKTPWTSRVVGHLGFTREGGRGRLDMTAEGANGQVGATDAGVRYAFARIVISSQLGQLRGCSRPMVIRWAGARFLTRFEGDVHVPPGPGHVVTWNPPSRGGIPRASARGPAAFWTPLQAPPSWGALFVQVPAVTEVRRILPDSTAKPR